jgi:hypothetical protein
LASVTLNGITGHVPGIIPVTFAGLSVTFPESPVTLDRNTQSDEVWQVNEPVW